MGSFDKFIEDLEQKRIAKEKRAQDLKRAHENHHQRRRVKLYSERWSNAVRYVVPWSKK